MKLTPRMADCGRFAANAAARSTLNTLFNRRIVGAKRLVMTSSL